MILTLLPFLYGGSGLVFLIVSLKPLIKNKYIRIFDCVRLMYTFTYGIVPAITYYYESIGERNLSYFNYNNSVRLIILYVLTIMGYFFMSLVYFCFKPKQSKENLVNNREKNTVQVLYAGLICLCIGWIGLYLWTKAYGSISNFIENASAIRSGRGTIKNSLAFMKYFAYLLPISLYALISSYLTIRPNGIKKIRHIIYIVIAGIGSLYYILASDSRISVAFIGVAIIIIMFRHEEKKASTLFLKYGLIAIGVFLLTVFADFFTNYLRYHVIISHESEFGHSIIGEFGFVISSQMKVLDMWFSGEIRMKLGDDIINALVSWFPESRIPFSTPDTIWKYNTLNIIGSTSHGTIPTDLITCGFYSCGLIGAVFFPMIYAVFIAVADRGLEKRRTSAHNDIYYGAIVGYFVNSLSHYQLSSFIGRFFPLFLYVIVVIFLNNIKVHDSV